MAAFDYLALDSSGHREKGVIDADTARMARRELRMRQLTPLRITEGKPLARRGASGIGRKPLSASAMLLFTRQLAMLVQSGTPVEEAVSMAAGQAETPGARKLLTALRTSVTEGYRLSDAMAEHPDVFGELYSSTVAAGETSGDLGLVMGRLADYLERSRKVRQTILAALIYPLILVVVALVVILGLMTFVVPKVVEQFQTMDQDVPALTQAMIGISDFLRGYGLILSAGRASGNLAWNACAEDRALQTRGRRHSSQVAGDRQNDDPDECSALCKDLVYSSLQRCACSRKSGCSQGQPLEPHFSRCRRFDLGKGSRRERYQFSHEIYRCLSVPYGTASLKR